MLTDLHIRNIAIIETLSVSFRKGLNVLTGETGAGKSIIIDSIGLLMGERASASLIRTGCDEASVEAVFDTGALPEFAGMLAEKGFDVCDELLIRRTVSCTGKGRIFINGSLATASQLAEITSKLVNVYGQHDSRILLQPERHLRILDAFAGLDDMRGNFEEVHAAYLAAEAELERLNADQREVARRCDLLSFQIDEIDRIRPISGEDEAMQSKIELLSHSGKLKDATLRGYETLYGSSGSLLSGIERTAAELELSASIDHSLAPVASSLREAAILLEDASLALRDYASRIESDPLELEKAEDRLDMIRRLKRKYGDSIEEILAYRDASAGELQRLINRDAEKQGIEERLLRLGEQRGQLAALLGEKRREAADRFSRDLQQELRQLAMKDAVVALRFEKTPEIRSTGLDRLEILFSPNPGEVPRPLAKIASGGELSRFMLAMKQILPEADVATLIFDEVDAGIGGAVSAVVGSKLLRVAGSQQVLCITHLPQVAAMGHHHFKVAKTTKQGRTTTTVEELDPDSRTEEIARMLAGNSVTGTARRHAAELLAGRPD